MTDGTARETIGTDVNDATNALGCVAIQSESPPRKPQLRCSRRPPVESPESRIHVDAQSVTHSGAPHYSLVLFMINTDAPVVDLDHELTRVRSPDRWRRPAAAKRLLAISTVCVLMSACGGGGGGSDAPVVTPPPAPAELAWDDGNWDQKEWK